MNGHLTIKARLALAGIAVERVYSDGRYVGASLVKTAYSATGRG